MTASPAVFVVHDNPEWFPPLEAAFAAEGVPVQQLLLGDGALDLDAEPPAGVWWSRLSASAHTRGRPCAKEHARALLAWLESHGRRVVNGTRVVELEVSKVAQHALLRRHGFDVPRTAAAFGRTHLARTARDFEAPFITKHNQGGKGLAVRRFEDHEQFAAHVGSPDFEEPVDGITLVQELLVAREPFITRAEFVGGRFVYAVRVDISAGAFELCPADACAVPGTEPFTLRTDLAADHPLIRRYERLLASAGVEVAGIEFMETVDGRTVTYDINTNTNYNPAVEAAAPVSAARAVARHLGDLLAAEHALEPARA